MAFIDMDEIGAKALLEKYGSSKALFFHGDIGKKQVLDEFIAEIVKQNKKVDALINNACISRGGVFSCSYEDFNYVLNVGVSAPYYLSQQLLNYFSENASIINISSTRAIMSQKNTESYTAAKGAISALTHALCVSLSRKVRVNCISPGWIDTTQCHQSKQDSKNSFEDNIQHPAGRVGTCEDIAQMCLFLCSDKASFITGENITIDGGMAKQMIYHNDYGWSYNPNNK